MFIRDSLKAGYMEDWQYHATYSGCPQGGIVSPILANIYLNAVSYTHLYNDDGKLMGLPLNRALWDEDGLMYDVIAGTFLVVGLGEVDFVSLSPELAQKYEEEFHQPEAFLPLGRRLMVILSENLC